MKRLAWSAIVAVVVGPPVSLLVLLGTFQGIEDWFKEMLVASIVSGFVAALVAGRLSKPAL